MSIDWKPTKFNSHRRAVVWETEFAGLRLEVQENKAGKLMLHCGIFKNDRVVGRAKPNPAELSQAMNASVHLVYRQVHAVLQAMDPEML